MAAAVASLPICCDRYPATSFNKQLISASKPGAAGSSPAGRAIQLAVAAERNDEEMRRTGTLREDDVRVRGGLTICARRQRRVRRQRGSLDASGIPEEFRPYIGWRRRC